MPNLFVALIMLISLFMKKKSGFIFGVLFGLLLDLFVGIRIGINAISLGIVGLLTEILDKNFSKDNRITVMFLISVLTIIAEVIVYILQVLFLDANIQIYEFIKIIMIEVLYNAMLMALFYPAFFTFGNKLEEDFMNNTFLNFWK